SVPARRDRARRGLSRVRVAAEVPASPGYGDEDVRVLDQLPARALQLPARRPLYPAALAGMTPEEREEAVFRPSRRRFPAYIATVGSIAARLRNGRVLVMPVLPDRARHGWRARSLQGGIHGGPARQA